MAEIFENQPVCENTHKSFPRTLSFLGEADETATDLDHRHLAGQFRYYIKPTSVHILIREHESEVAESPQPQLVGQRLGPTLSHAFQELYVGVEKQFSEFS